MDATQLNQAVADLTAQVAATEGIEGSAVTLISGFAAAVTKAVADAISADDAGDAGTVAVATTAIADVLARFKASSDALGVAVAARQ